MLRIVFPVGVFRHLVQLNLVDDHMAFDKALLHIDNALVPRTSELDIQGLFRHDKRTVDEDVREREQFKELRLFGRKLHQAFVRITCKNHEIESTLLDFSSERDKRSRLIHRIATAERYAIEQRVFLDHRDDGFALNKMPPFKIMRLRILTARAIVVAPLRKNSQTDSGTVNKRFRLNSSDS